MLWIRELIHHSNKSINYVPSCRLFRSVSYDHLCELILMCININTLLLSNNPKVLLVLISFI